MGFALVSIGLLTLFVMIKIFAMDNFYGWKPQVKDRKQLFEALAGYGLGGSTVALFSRVGGGIYTKAADVGADLCGKNEWGMDEDDPRNPACIADNVGDNVGDVAGMGADWFGSFAESSCAALLIAASVPALHSWSPTLYPLMLSSTGILTGALTLLIVQSGFSVRGTDG